MKKILIAIAFLTGQTSYSQSFNDDIVLIGIGKYDKSRIADLISIVTEQNPKVVSVDIAFPEYRADQTDKKLYTALWKCPRLVMPSALSYSGTDYYGKEIIIVYLTCSMAFFPIHAKSGFISAEKDSTTNRVPSSFFLWQKAYTGETHEHFSIVTAMQYDSTTTTKFVRNNGRVANIDFSTKRQFKTFTHDEILKKRFDRKDIEGKIVMMGYLGPGNHDRYISPWNSNSNKPDIYGLEYLAYIVTQILGTSNQGDN